MKKRGKRQEETGGQWIGTMCEVLKGGAAAGVTAVLALLLCAFLISAGVLRERWAWGRYCSCCC